MRAFWAAALALAPGVALAVGSEDDAPPKPTNTTKTCVAGKVWSEQSQTCVDPKSGRLDDEALFGAAREFAYAGQYENTLAVLAAMSDAMDPRVLTYKGFVHRKMGDVAAANAYYRQAISVDPGTLLARSYMGQGFVEAGDIAAARDLLIEIRRLGGVGTWAEASLRQAIETGAPYRY